MIDDFDSQPEWLIIDEYGKLELKGEGLEPAITSILNNWKVEKRINLLIIIRDYLVSDLIKKFDKEINFREFIIEP